MENLSSRGFWWKLDLQSESIPSGVKRFSQTSGPEEKHPSCSRTHPPLSSPPSPPLSLYLLDMVCVACWVSSAATSLWNVEHCARLCCLREHILAQPCDIPEDSRPKWDLGKEIPSVDSKITFFIRQTSIAFVHHSFHLPNRSKNWTSAGISTIPVHNSGTTWLSLSIELGVNFHWVVAYETLVAAHRRVCFWKSNSIACEKTWKIHRVCGTWLQPLPTGFRLSGGYESRLPSSRWELCHIGVLVLPPSFGVAVEPMHR